MARKDTPIRRRPPQLGILMTGLTKNKRLLLALFSVAVVLLSVAFHYSVARLSKSTEAFLSRDPVRVSPVLDATPSAHKTEESFAMSKNNNKKRYPEGIIAPPGMGQVFSSSSIRTADAWIEAGPKGYQNTFAVQEQHVVLEGGVRFNVETVPGALPKHLHKPRLGRTDLYTRLQTNAAVVYSQQAGDYGLAQHQFSRYGQLQMLSPEQIRLEAVSQHNDNDNLVYMGENGFLVACLTAFAQHLPLKLSPDHVWTLISHAFARHVDNNAEALRHVFVQHEGKKRLLVTTPNDFEMSQRGNPDTGATAADWEMHVFPNFSEQIRAYIGNETYQAIVADFSTTDAASQAASEITLMSAMKNYFSFGFQTLCGIPNITLMGTLQDWVDLRTRTEQLGKLMTPEFSEYWMPLLLPILDEFVESYKGNVNHGFWQSMVKLRNNGMGSGYQEFISGWMQILFPYLKSDSLNTQLRPWQEMYFSGPEPGQFPPAVSSAPVDWEYFGKTFDIHFHSGIAGFTQDSADGALTPLVGWCVTHDPPLPVEARRAKLQAEMDALRAGYKDEFEAGTMDPSEPWYHRYKQLLHELESLGPSGSEATE